MRLTSFSDYALRVLMYLTIAPDNRATIDEITEKFAISRNHLTKVVHLLGQKGFLNNTRGRGGGLNLALPPEEINIGAVVRVTEGKPCPAECFNRERNQCRIARVCHLRGVLGDAAEAFYRVLDQHTLADITNNETALRASLAIAPLGA